MKTGQDVRARTPLGLLAGMPDVKNYKWDAPEVRLRLKVIFIAPVFSDEIALLPA